MKVKPMGMLLMMLAEWINRHQQDVTVRTRVSLVGGTGKHCFCRCSSLWGTVRENP